MAFDFPAAPAVGQIYTPFTGTSYVWNGSSWDKTQQSQWATFTMPAGLIMPFGGDTPPPGALVCNGQTFNRTFQAALFAVIGTKFGAGDGSTTANVPDLRGRTVIGLDTNQGGFADRVTNSGIGNSGINSRTMGVTGGFDRYTLVAAQAPPHQHGGSGTTSGVSNDHSHLTSGQTAGHNVDHAHYVSVMTDTHGGHQHDITGTNVTNTAATGGNSRIAWTGSYLSGVAGAHAHAVNTWSGGVSTDHSHAFSAWSGGINQNHTHTYSFATDVRGGGEAHPIMQPSIVLNYVIFTGEAV